MSLHTFYFWMFEWKLLYGKDINKSAIGGLRIMGSAQDDINKIASTVKVAI